MIVGTCGFGSTGSSVVTDYLSEYNDICVLDKIEFSWVWEPDGILDLRNHILNPNGRIDSILAIKRFYGLMHRLMRYYERAGGLNSALFNKSVDDFIKSITAVSWYWRHNEYRGFLTSILKESILFQRLIPFLEKKIGRRIESYPFEKVNLSVKPENFDECAKKHVKELLMGLGADFSKIVVLDQSFSGNNPQVSLPFFDDAYAVVVDRDPRDVYVFGNTRLMGFDHFMPISPVEDFIAYYKNLRDGQPYRTHKDNRVLNLRFEDMVYNYDETTAVLRNFLHLKDNPNPKKIFDPSLSINNTQVWKRFPKFTDDIKVIERELKEYLFDFDKYGNFKIQGEMFFGKSPLHKR